MGLLCFVLMGLLVFIKIQNLRFSGLTELMRINNNLEIYNKMCAAIQINKRKYKPKMRLAKTKRMKK